MKVTEFISQAENPLISVEIIPPARGGSFAKLKQAIDSILPFKPPFIDVTSHSAEVMWLENPDGTFKRVVKRKSPGTFGICAAIKYKYNVEPVPHLLCAGFTREETEDALIELNYLGVENVLAIKGDSKFKKLVQDGRTVNAHATDLVHQLNDMNHGRYLDKLEDSMPTDFCVGVSAYPEKHFESPNLAFDINVLLEKQKAGAHYAVSQMFFDNRHYYSYVEKARAAGVTIPILPGLKILATKGQLNTIPSAFHIDFPEELTERLVAAKDNKEVLEVGIDWAYQQAVDLLSHNAPLLHFYVMQNTTPFVTLMDRLKKAM